MMQREVVTGQAGNDFGAKYQPVLIPWSPNTDVLSCPSPSHTDTQGTLLKATVLSVHYLQYEPD